jgi:membrane-bound lytic murein transglycosylase B
MNRRIFLLSTASLATAPAGLPQAPPAGDTPPSPPPPDLAGWLDQMRPKALAAGVSQATIDAAFTGLTVDATVQRRDSNQPEFSKPIGDYMAAVLSPGTISMGQGRGLALSSVIEPISKASGVPPEILLAVWGVESSFGRVTGDQDVIRSLATIGVIGRRPKLAEQEMIAALQILDRGLAGREQLKGSWAGAMGQTQFMPSDYLTYGADGDGDGKVDIWGSSADALASTARFLQVKAHWHAGQSWASEAVVPAGFDYQLCDAEARKPVEWAEMGVGLMEGVTAREGDADAAAVLMLPAGWRGPAFLGFPNHMSIRAYNNSTAYALSVGLLADQIAGRPSLVRPWPKDPPLALADRIAAQQALRTLGFDPGATDGVLGIRTRKAAKLWQAQRGLPADGYLNAEVIQLLKSEAGLSGAAPAAVAPPSGAA